MPYSITTKDGITIDNIPDDVPQDSPDLKARVAAIRAGGGATAAPAPAASSQVAPSAQSARDQEAIPILLKELEAAQVLKNAGDTRAASDVDAIVRELATKGVKVDAMAAPASAAPAAAPMLPEQSAQPQTGFMQGFFEGISEQVTGRARATPETQALPEWVNMPELNQLSVAGFKTALGTLMSNPEETVQVLQANFPGVQVRQDAKGNYLLRSSVDQKEYAITPGLTFGDVPRVASAIAAFTPAGRALTIPGAVASSGATQAVIEASQAATGGKFDTGEVGMAAATGPVGQVLQRVVPPVVQAVKRGIQGRAPAQPPAAAAAAERPEPSFFRETSEAPAGTPTPEPPPPTPPVAPTTTTTVTTEVVNNLVQKASGTGFGSAAARDKLADLAQINVAAKEAADRLGIQLPADVFSDNPQVRAAAGLTRSLAAGEAEAAWRTTVTQAVDRADDVIKQFDAQFVEGAVAPGVVSQKIKDSLTKTRSDLNAAAGKIYNAVDEVVPKTSVVELPKLKATLDSVKAEVGEAGMSSAERNLSKMIDEGSITYGRLQREKGLIGKALNKMESPYGSMAEADLKRLYAALADDQLTNVGRIGG